MIIAMNRFAKNPEGMAELIMSPFQGLVMLTVFCFWLQPWHPFGIMY